MRLKPHYRLFLFILASGAAVAEPERYSSPLPIVAGQRGEVLYVGEKTARQGDWKLNFCPGSGG